MDQGNSSSSSQVDASSSKQEVDPSIEAYLNSGYDKHIKRARNVLFVISAIQIVNGIFIGMRIDVASRTAVYIESLIVAGVFLALALWSRKKPYPAILTAIIFYLLYQALLIIFNPAAIFQGIIFKAVIVVYLLLGLNNAKSKYPHV